MGVQDCLIVVLITTLSAVAAISQQCYWMDLYKCTRASYSHSKAEYATTSNPQRENVSIRRGPGVVLQE